MKGTLSLSWGRWGGFYVRFRRCCWRVCLGCVALTWTCEEWEQVVRAWLRETGR